MSSCITNGSSVTAGTLITPRQLNPWDNDSQMGAADDSEGDSISSGTLVAASFVSSIPSSRNGKENFAPNSILYAIDDCGVSGSKIMEVSSPVSTRSSSGGVGAVELDNSNLRRKLTALRQENAALVRQNQDILSNLEKVTWEFCKAQNHIKVLDTQISSLNSPKSTNITVLQERAAQLESQSQSYERLVAEADEDRATLQCRLDEAANLAAEHRLALDRSKEEVQVEREARRCAELALQEMRQVSQERLSQAETESQTAQLAVQAQVHLRSECSILRQELDAVKLRAAQLMQERDKLTLKHPSRLARLQDEIAQLRQECTKLKHDVLVRDSTIRDLESSAHNASVRCAKAESCAQTLREEASRLEQQLAQGRSVMEERASRINVLEQQIAETATSTALQQRLTQLENQLAAANDAFHEASQRAELAAKAQNQGAQECSVWMDKYRQVEFHLTNLKQVNSAVQEQLALAQRELDVVRDEASRQTCIAATSDERLRLREERLAETEAEMGRLRTRTSQAELQAKRSAVELSQLRVELERTSSSTADLRDNLNTAVFEAAAASTAKQHFSDLVKQSEVCSQQLRTQLAAAIDAKKKMKREANALTQRLTLLERQLLEMSQVVQKNVEKEEALKAELAHKTSLQETMLAQLEERACEGSAQMCMQEDALKMCKAELVHLETAYRLVDSELSALRERYEQQDSQLNRTREALQEAQDASEERLVMAENAALRVEELDKEILRMQDVVTERETALSQARIEIRSGATRLQEALQQTSVERESAVQYRDRVLALERQIRELERRIEECAEDSRRSQEQLTQSRESNQQMSRVVEELRHEKEALRKEAVLTADRIRQLESDRDRLEEQIKVRETAHREVLAEANVCSSALQAAREEVARNARSCEDARREASDAHKSIQEMGSTLQRVQETLIARNRELEQLRVALKERAAELDSRSAQFADLEKVISAAQKSEQDERTRLAKHLCQAQEVERQQRQRADHLEHNLHEKVQLMLEAERRLKQLSRELERRGRLVNDLQRGKERDTLEQARLERELLVAAERLLAAEASQERLLHALDDAARDRESLIEEAVTARLAATHAESQASAEVRRTAQRLDEMAGMQKRELAAMLTADRLARAEAEQEAARASAALRQLHKQLEAESAACRAAEARAFAAEEAQRTSRCRLQAAEESLVVQDSTVARLEAKLDHSQRSCDARQRLALSAANSDSQSDVCRLARPFITSMESELDWTGLEVDADGHLLPISPISLVSSNAIFGVDVSKEAKKDVAGLGAEDQSFLEDEDARQRLAQLQMKLAALGVHRNNSTLLNTDDCNFK